MSIDDSSWTEHESETYRHISRYAVPERERQVSVAVALVSAAADIGPIVELCCGEGLLTQPLLRALPGRRIIALDGSPSMLAATRMLCEESPMLETRAFDLAAPEWRAELRSCSAVVSSLAVHHLDGLGKRQLFADIHTMLGEGGVFVLIDVIQPASGVGERIAGRLWDEEVRRRAMEQDGSLAGFEAFQNARWNHFHTSLEPGSIDRPSSVAEHIDWMREEGFSGVDLHWMMAGHALFSAWKK
jgi:tRNA (cmo5U34)-methyltransferase